MRLKPVQWIVLFGCAFASSGAAQPYPGDWGQDSPYGAQPSYLEPPGTRDPREGKVQVQTFVASAPAAAVLGHGPLSLSAGNAGPDAGRFEAAIAEQLTHAGYHVGGQGTGQMLSFVVRRQLVQPPEPPHSPVHGAVGVGVAGGGSHYGSGMGLGLAIDLSKPLSALISTEIEARITDATTRELLWQGRAEVLSRESDKRWRLDLIPARLTAELFRNFPRATAR